MKTKISQSPRQRMGMRRKLLFTVGGVSVALIAVALVFFQLTKTEGAKAFSQRTAHTPVTEPATSGGSTVTAPIIPASQRHDGYGAAPSAPTNMPVFEEVRREKGAELTWVTGYENSNALFEVERSVNGGMSWEKIAEVKGQGTTRKRHTYVYHDQELVGVTADEVLYRFKQVSENGAFTYSPVRKVRLAPELLTALK